MSCGVQTQGLLIQSSKLYHKAYCIQVLRVMHHSIIKQLKYHLAKCIKIMSVMKLTSVTNGFYFVDIIVVENSIKCCIQVIEKIYNLKWGAFFGNGCKSYQITEKGTTNDSNIQRTVLALTNCPCRRGLAKKFSHLCKIF